MAELRFSCVADHSTCYSTISSLLLDSSGSWYRLSECLSATINNYGPVVEADAVAGMEGEIEEPEELPDTYADAAAEAEGE